MLRDVNISEEYLLLFYYYTGLISAFLSDQLTNNYEGYAKLIMRMRSIRETGVIVEIYSIILPIPEVSKCLQI